MSLVAYASSEEESDAEEAAGEEEEAAAPPSPAAAEQPPARGLFASLPPPKAPALLPPHQALGSGFPLPPPHGGPPPPFLMGPPPGVRGFSTPPPGMSPAQASALGPPEPAASGNGSGEQPRLGGLLLPPPRNAATTTAASTLNLPPPVSASAALPAAGVDLSLPKPKKRTEPVRITAPELHKGDVSMKQPPSSAGEAGRWGGALPEPSAESAPWCVKSRIRARYRPHRRCVRGGSCPARQPLILKRFVELNWRRNLIYTRNAADYPQPR